MVLDYGGPNVAKAMHVGHLRPCIIGDSLRRMALFAGYKAIGDVHLGDVAMRFVAEICCVGALCIGVNIA